MAAATLVAAVETRVAPYEWSATSGIALGSDSAVRQGDRSSMGAVRALVGPGDQLVGYKPANEMPANIGRAQAQPMQEFSEATPGRRLAIRPIALIPSPRRQLSGRVEVDRPDSRRSGTDKAVVG
jgi:hypothetical protein